MNLLGKEDAWGNLIMVKDLQASAELDVFQNVDKAIIWANELIQSINNAQKN